MLEVDVFKIFRKATVFLSSITSTFFPMFFTIVKPFEEELKIGILKFSKEEYVRVRRHGWFVD